MTVERLEREMSGAELDEWVEFYKLEPFGNEEKMHDFRHASLCSLIVNMMGSNSKPNDFLMYQDIKKEEEDALLGWEEKLLKAMTKV